VIPGRTLSQNEPGDGRLSPWADAAADAPGWQITTRSRRLAVAVATVMSGGTVHSHTKGEWHARIPQAVLMVVVRGRRRAVSRLCGFSAGQIGPV